MTPLEMTTSKLSSSNGSSSIRASTNSTCEKPVASRRRARLGELLVGEVDADDAARLADEHGRAEDVGARARPEVEHRVAGLRARRGRGDGRRRRTTRAASAGMRVEQPGRIAEVLGQLAADLEVQVGVLVARDVAVHGLDLGLEALAVDERAGIKRFHARQLTGRR